MITIHVQESNDGIHWRDTRHQKSTFFRCLWCRLFGHKWGEGVNKHLYGASYRKCKCCNIEEVGVLPPQHPNCKCVMEATE